MHAIRILALLTTGLVLPLGAAPTAVFANADDDCEWELSTFGMFSTCPIGIGGSAPQVGLRVTGPLGIGRIECSGSIRAFAANQGTSVGVFGTASEAGVHGEVLSGRRNASGVLGTCNSESGSGVRGEYLGEEGAGVHGESEGEHGELYGVRGITSSGEGAGVYGRNWSRSGGAAAVFGESGLGIGVLGFGGSTGVYGVLLNNESNLSGVRGETSSLLGSGVSGAAPTLGVKGLAYGESGVGVHGINSSGERGDGIGVLGDADGDRGIGVKGEAGGETAIGVRGETQGAYAIGVFGINTTTVRGEQYGVKGQASGAAGVGVLGINTSTRGNTIGVRGESASESGFGGYFVGRGYFSGSTGIGTSSPLYTLHVAGSAGKPGGGSWSNASDIRLKTDIQPLHNALDRLTTIRGVTYEYIDAASINELPGRQLGVIAQEVEAVFPQWVDEGVDGMKRVTYRGFEAVAIEAMRELKNENDVLVSRISEVEAQSQAAHLENEALAARVAQLEALVGTILNEK